MEWLANIPHYFLSFTVVISTIVFVHEFGHFIVARACGVRVEVFSIGFGKEMFGWNDKHGTRWKLAWLPFGGYVKMFGDAGAASTADVEKLEAMHDAEKPYSFHFKPLWQKALIVAAGPVANFLLTIAVFTYFIFTTGLASTSPVVGEVLPDSAAYEAGFKKGDKITRIDDEEITRFSDISRIIITNLGKPVDVTFDRKGETKHVTLTPRMVEDEDALGNKVKRPLIGIRSQNITYHDVGLGSALAHAVQQTYELCETSLHVLGQMIRGERSADELKGPLGIAKLSGEATQQGETTRETLRTVLWFIAMLSVNLGLVNLFPIPMLDGGHLMYYALEAVRGRPMAEKFQEYGFRFGFLMIASLMAFTIFNDIRQLIL